MIKQKIIDFKNSVTAKVKSIAIRVKNSFCRFFKKTGNLFKKATVSTGLFFNKTGTNIVLFFKKSGVATAAFFKKYALVIALFFKTKYFVCIDFCKKTISRAKEFLLGESAFNAFVKKHRKWFASGSFVLYTIVIIVVTVVVIGVINKPKPFVVEIDKATEKQQNEQSGHILQYGKNIELSHCSLLYEGTDFETVISPENAKKIGEYISTSYINENKDNVYMDIKIRYTNKSNEVVTGDNAVKMTATVDGVLKNCTFTAVENPEGTNMDFSSMAQIKPGETVLIHCIFDAPKDTQKAMEIIAQGFSEDKSYVINITEEIKENG